MKPPDRHREALSLNEPHRVIRAAIGISAQAVDRHDAGMLEIARDLRLEHEPRSMVLPFGEPGLDLLERHVALQLTVARHPDLADSPLGMRPDQLKTLALRRRQVLVQDPCQRVFRRASTSGRVWSPPSDAPRVVRSASSLISVSTS